MEDQVREENMTEEMLRVDVQETGEEVTAEIIEETVTAAPADAADCLDEISEVDTVEEIPGNAASDAEGCEESAEELEAEAETLVEDDQTESLLDDSDAEIPTAQGQKEDSASGNSPVKDPAAGDDMIEDDRDLISVVGVRFRTAGKSYYFATGELPVRRGSHVIVETSRGLEYGTSVCDPIKIHQKRFKAPIKKITRMSTAADDQRVKENREKEREAFRICFEKIRRHSLDMKLIDAEYTFDNSKILFYFTSDGRVDFRDLVKDLAGVFHTRIELRQIGVRDETKILGGYGICGRPLCCHTYLADFVPVSIKMAKEQNLSLNPTKISGSCGRLMCCLKNEEETYEALNKNLPRLGDEVQTSDGLTGEVASVNILKQTVRILVEVNDEKEVHECSAEEITILRRRKRGQAKPKINRSELKSPSGKGGSRRERIGGKPAETSSDASGQGQQTGDADQRETADSNTNAENGERGNQGRAGRNDRGERNERRDRGERYGSSRGDRSGRGDRNSRNGQDAQNDRGGSERSERGNRNDRSDRNDRGERSDRSDRNDRGDRSDRSDRNDHGDRRDRSDRNDRNDRNGGRGRRNDRGERNDRERNDRNDRGDRNGSAVENAAAAADNAAEVRTQENTQRTAAPVARPQRENDARPEGEGQDQHSRRHHRYRRRNNGNDRRREEGSTQSE